MLTILIALGGPIALIMLCQYSRLLDRIGLVVLAFGTGLILSSYLALTDTHTSLYSPQVASSVSDVSIALALPLLVFSLNLRSVFAQSRQILVSFAIAVLCVVIAFVLLGVAFQKVLPEISGIAGMAVGAYTGGGPNMAAIKTAIGATDDLFLTMVTYDLLLSAIYLMVIMAFGQAIFRKLLPSNAPVQAGLSTAPVPTDTMTDESAQSYRRLIQSPYRLDSLWSLCAAAICVGLSVALASLAPKEHSALITIIAITTLGTLASLIPRIRSLRNSFTLGNYLILVFCFTIGSQTDIHALSDLNLSLFAYIGLSLIVAISLHAAIARLLRIDADTFLVTSTAAVLSVPFIPVITNAIHRRALLGPGLSVAIVGYLLGSYLGIASAFLLSAYLS